MNKYVVELIGTFFLVLTIGLTAETPGNLAPIAIGSVLMVMIFAGGHVSGAHYNPAITIAIWLRGRCEASVVAPYIGAQIAGAGVAAWTVDYLSDAVFTSSTFELGPAMVAEVLFTFALCWVILNVATSSGTEGNSFYGLAIAATVVAGIYAVGPISGAAFNPAVSVALCMMGLFEWGTLGYYFLAQIFGALLGTFAFKAFVAH